MIYKNPIIYEKLVRSDSTRRKMEGQPEYLGGQVDQI